VLLKLGQVDFIDDGPGKPVVEQVTSTFGTWVSATPNGAALLGRQRASARPLTAKLAMLPSVPRGIRTGARSEASATGCWRPWWPC
jgi:hypothetical protein